MQRLIEWTIVYEKVVLFEEDCEFKVVVNDACVLTTTNIKEAESMYNFHYIRMKQQVMRSRGKISRRLRGHNN